MKHFTLTIAILTLGLPLLAQNKFDVATIPEALKKNAHSIVREEAIELEVKDIGRASYKVHKVVTVLNESGKRGLFFQASCDEFRTLENISLQLFDPKGKLINKYKRSDLHITMAEDDLVPDGKIYYLDLSTQSFPVTLQVDYEILFKGLLFYPGYSVELTRQSIENSSYTATVPAGLDLRYKAKNTKIAPVVKNENQKKIYTWSVKQQLPFEKEEGSGESYSSYPHIMLAPNKFDMGGYEGDMSTWESFGKWNELLIKKSNNLTEARKEFFRDLVKTATTDREKAKIIYNYLQRNFRYVSIQLGMGGWIPFKADFVDQKKYGDCKALSNYTMACLEAVGVKSHYALINSAFDGDPLDADFPHNGFNHAILCVPQPKDSIWLECTSNTKAFGTLGNSTENRYALLVTDHGGKLVPTPKSKAPNNQFSAVSIIQLAVDGSGTADCRISTTGEYDDIADYLGTQKRDNQKHALVNYLDFMNPDDFQLTYDTANHGVPITLKLYFQKAADFTAGKKLFMNPRIYKIWSSSLPTTENRKQDYFFQHPFIKTDTTVYKLPEGFAIETLPKAKNVTYEYGSFNSTYVYDEANKQVVSVARLQLNEYRIPALKFESTKKFFNEVLAEYTEKIVIRKL